MTRKDVIRNTLELAEHNLLCYSQNWNMAIPKKGQEEQHQKVSEEVEILRAMLAEEQQKAMISELIMKYVVPESGYNNTPEERDSSEKKLKTMLEAGSIMSIEKMRAIIAEHGLPERVYIDSGSGMDANSAKTSAQ